MSLFNSVLLSVGLVLTTNHVLVAAGVPKINLTNSIFRDFLEQFRLRMHMDMTDSLGIPRLDPFTMDSLVMNSNELAVMGLDK